jgi:hypothetical protein
VKPLVRGSAFLFLFHFLCNILEYTTSKLFRKNRRNRKFSANFLSIFSLNLKIALFSAVLRHPKGLARFLREVKFFSDKAKVTAGRSETND